MVIRGVLLLFLLLGVPGTGWAQSMCGVDLDGDGEFTGVLETALCPAPDHCPLTEVACLITDPVFVCPREEAINNACTALGGTCDYVEEIDTDLDGIADDFGEVTEDCVVESGGAPAICPLGDGYACRDFGSGPVCSDMICQSVTGDGAPVDESRAPGGLADDGERDAEGGCLDEIRIFNGFGMDCRSVGAQTLFENCCDDEGKIIYDTGGGGIGAPLVVTGVSSLFAGLSAAHTAYTGGASAAAAASTGSSAMLAAFDPTTLAIAAAVTFMVDMLNLGCDAQDMETGILRGSGMCHYIEDYCAVSLPFIGCIQKKRAHCCFNSVLGRIIHEQGRSQLQRYDGVANEGWGTAEEPLCDGFTAQEFQALDFGQMDLSEYYDELRTSTAAEMQILIEEGVDDYADTNTID